MNDIVKKARIKAQTIEEKKQDLSGQWHHYFVGKYDWCSDSATDVSYLYDSEIEIGGIWRLAQACDEFRSDFSL